MDINSAKKELVALYEERIKVGAFFYSVISGFLSAGLLGLMFFHDDYELWALILFGVLLLWSVGTALRIIPAPDPPRKWWDGYERIKYLEGFIAGRNIGNPRKKN